MEEGGGPSCSASPLLPREHAAPADASSSNRPPAGSRHVSRSDAAFSSFAADAQAHVQPLPHIIRAGHNSRTSASSPGACCGRVSASSAASWISASLTLSMAGQLRVRQCMSARHAKTCDAGVLRHPNRHGHGFPQREREKITSMPAT